MNPAGHLHRDRQRVQTEVKIASFESGSCGLFARR